MPALEGCHRLDTCCRDYWARFERFVKQLTYTFEEVYVISGPLYLPQRTPQGFQMQHSMIGATLAVALS